MDKKILFISNRNITNTCGELRLIKNRAESIYKEYNIQTDFIAYTHKPIINHETIESGGNMVIINHSFAPINCITSYNTLKRTIKNSLKNTEYSIVIVSGILLLHLVDYIRFLRPDIKIIADIHGASEELIEFPGKNSLLTAFRKMYYVCNKFSEKKYLNRYDYILVVSSGLRKYIINSYSVDSEKIKIAPCAIECKEHNKSEITEIRNKARKKYNIKENEKLFIYSGGVSKWQCIDETVELFNQVANKINDCKMLILSGNLETIEKYKSDKIIVDSLNSEEVPFVLTAGDFAFLIRDNCVTNHVAYPNKFLEYVEAGMKIITTPYVEEVSEETQKYNLGYVLKSTRFEEGLLEYCLKPHQFLEDLPERERLIYDVSFVKRMNFINE